MAQREYIPVLDDGSVVTSSPLTYIDTLYYETMYRIAGNANWTQQIDYPPLAEYQTVSPAGSNPCVIIKLLPDGTEYEYKIRRFNSNNVPSDWVEGTFTTGIS